MLTLLPQETEEFTRMSTSFTWKQLLEAPARRGVPAGPARLSRWDQPSAQWSPVPLSFTARETTAWREPEPETSQTQTCLGRRSLTRSGSEEEELQTRGVTAGTEHHSPAPNRSVLLPATQTTPEQAGHRHPSTPQRRSPRWDRAGGAAQLCAGTDRAGPALPAASTQ